MKMKNAKGMNNPMNKTTQEINMSKKNKVRRDQAEWLKREKHCKQTWVDFIKTHEIPDYFPARPDLAYANEGWQSWQHFISRVLTIANTDAETLKRIINTVNRKEVSNEHQS
jgi:hypothetical protein